MAAKDHLVLKTQRIEDKCMKKTILGTLIVILTMLSQISFAQGIGEVETQRDEYIRKLVRNAKSIYETYKKEKQNYYSFANMLRNNQPTIVTIEKRQIPAEKAFDLDKRVQIAKSDDEGSTRVLTSGHLKILGLTYDKKKVAVEYAEDLKVLETLPTHRFPERSGASEVYLVNVEDLGLKDGQN